MSGELDNLALALASAGVQHTYVKSKSEDMAELSQALASAGLRHMLVGGASEVVAEEEGGYGKPIANSKPLVFSGPGIKWQPETRYNDEGAWLRGNNSSGKEFEAFLGTDADNAAIRKNKQRILSTGNTTGCPIREVRDHSSEAEASADSEKRIRISYETWDEDALDAGETDDKGWENEEGVDFTDDGDETAVDQAVDFLKKEGATEFSSGAYDPRGYYSTESGSDAMDPQTGETTVYSYHLTDGWTDEEKKAIYDGVIKGASSNEAEASTETVITAAGYTHLDDRIVSKIESGLPFKINNGSVNGSPRYSSSGWARDEAKEVIQKLQDAGADYWIYSYGTPILARLNEQWYDIPGNYSPATTRHQGGLSRQFNATTFDETVTNPDVRRPVAPGGLDLDAEASVNLSALSSVLATAGVKHTVVTAFEPSAPIDVVITSGTVKKQLTIKPNRYAAEYNVGQLAGAIESWSKKYMGPAEATASTEVVAFGARRLPEAAMVKIERGLPFKINEGSVSGSPTFRGAGWAENNHDSMQAIEKLEGMNADYWLYSYATPIGARVGDQWYIIPGKYTRTTTNHQHILSDLGAKPLGDVLPPDVRRPVAPGGLDLD